MTRGILEDRQQAFIREFRADRYQRFLEELDRRSGTHVKFRVAEMPCFFERELLDEANVIGRDLILQLTESPSYLARAHEEIPAKYCCPGDEGKPLFVQADFSLVRDANDHLHWKLVEIQGFPSLYGFQPTLARTFIDAYQLGDEWRWFAPGIDEEAYRRRLQRALLGQHHAENVVLLEIHPDEQKTLPDFLITEKLTGIQTVCITKVRKEGRKLFYKQHGQWVPIHRIYNRVIVDELDRSGVETPFSFTDDLDVEWAGHPNWYFLISKFSIPHLHHASLPRSQFLSDVTELPEAPENLVLKPLYSFAGLGVKVGPTREEIDAVPQELRSHYLLQERMRFEPLIATPFGKSQAEVRVMFLWDEQLEPVTYIVRTGRGKMMGVDQNRDLEWVGASAALYL